MGRIGDAIQLLPSSRRSQGPVGGPTPGRSRTPLGYRCRRVTFTEPGREAKIKGSFFGVLALVLGMTFGAFSRADEPRPEAGKRPTTTIAANTALRMKFSSSGVASELSRSAADPFLLTTLPQPDNRVERLQDVRGKPVPSEPGRIVMSLFSDTAKGTLLVVQNGYDFPVTYNAVLILDQDGTNAYRRTSVCPVRSRFIGVESWPKAVVGIVVTDLRPASSDNMSCSDGSALSVSAAVPDDPSLFACEGGKLLDGRSSAQVTLTADGKGAVREARATWALTPGSVATGPSLLLNYPLVGDVAAPHPSELAVFAVVPTAPPPSAKSATIHLLLNGVEKIVTPWRLYAQQRAALEAQTQKPVAFFGIVPISPQTTHDAGLAAILSAVGEPGADIEVRIVGDDGSILGDAHYPVGAPLVRSKTVINSLLAEAKSKTNDLSRCRKLAAD